MKRKNGFTLVEILVTISLLSLIMIIVVPSVITINKKVKNKLYNTKVSQAEEATLLWVQNNPNCLNSDDDSCMISKSNCTSYADDENKIQCTITMGKLAANNLIKYDDEEKEDIYSPIDNASMKSVEISFIYNLKTKLISIKPVKTTTKKTTTIKQPSTPEHPFNPSGSKDDVNYCLNFYNDKSGTLLAGIKNNYPNATDPITIPGKKGSAKDEAVLASTPDDYGNSLYFRGDVQNNYVQFAGMCWRIVRITGDCSIKLVLQNRNDAKYDNSCSYDQDYQYTIGESVFNEVTGSHDNAYIGFMYGDTNADSYAKTHANKNKSTVLKKLETWYKSKLDLYKSKLADVIWCNDKSVPDDRQGGYGTIDTGYGSSYRLYKGEPSLICPNDKLGGKLSKFTVDDKKNGNGDLDYKIGLLTVDELIFAGFHNYNVPEDVNTSYLGTSSMYADSDFPHGGYASYLTLSPAGRTFFFIVGPYLYNGKNNGKIIRNRLIMAGDTGFYYLRTSSIDSKAYSQVRPAIALVKDIKIDALNGAGTRDNPFRIID